MLSYGELGAKEIVSADGNSVHFGILLPHIENTKFGVDINCVIESSFYGKNDVFVKPLTYDQNNSYGLWKGDIKSDELHSGQKDAIKFIYWYSLKDSSGKLITDHIIDPFSREFGLGKFSAFTLNYQKHEWSDTERSWRTPQLKDLIIYELHINEFGKDIDGCINRIDYLSDLGVNCIEIMPVHNIIDTVNWGYLPLGHFGVDERFGNRKNLQVLVDEAHKKNIAVIMDVVFGHTGFHFTYFDLYLEKVGDKYRQRLGMMSPFNKEEEKWGGALVDFSQKLAFEYYEAVMHNFFDNYHVDGFRFDCVSEYFDGFRQIVKKARDLVAMHKWDRFEKTQPVLCAEYLTDENPPQYILDETESNCCCQNNTLDVATALANAIKSGDNEKVSSHIVYLGESNFSNHWYPAGKFPLLYCNSHDHGRFICNFYDSTMSNYQNLLFEDYNWTYGQRKKHWFKVQPFLIGLLMARGIPFLWQGEELSENYYVNENIYDISRVKLFRDVRWEYFFDEPGRIIHDLVKLLIQIRKQYSRLFTDGEYKYHKNDDHLMKRVLVFERLNLGINAIVVLNFGGDPQTIVLPENVSGYYDLIKNRQCSTGNRIEVDRYYGSIIIKK